MSNVLKPDKQEEVRALGRLGWSLRRIEEATGVRRETVGAYLRQAGIQVRAERGRRFSAEAVAELSKPASHPTTDSASSMTGLDSVQASTTEPKPASHPTAGSDALGSLAEPRWSPRVSSCESFREFIEQGLSRGRPAKAIWQDLVDDHAYAGGYESVKRFARKLRVSSPVPHPRIETPPGEEGQVDYGTGPMVRDPETGKYRRTRLFALTLGCSRKSVWLLTWRSSGKTWCQLHETAFHRLGGAPRVIVLDNLKEGVIGPDFYDPTINPLYRDVLKHYGTIALPAKVCDPDRKGKVESGIGFVQRRLAGMRFESMEAAQAYLDRWNERWADTRIHGTTKRQVAEMFAEEKPLLLPLPIAPFRYYQHGPRTVHLDGCVEIAGAYYSAPTGWVGHEVLVQWDDLFVRILHPMHGVLLAEHIRQKKKGHFRIRAEDRSKKTPLTVEKLLWRARIAGPHIGKVCEALEAQRSQYAARQILGVLSLAKRRGPEAVDGACKVALETLAVSYRFIRKYVERAIPEAPALRQSDPLIRDLAHYRDFINRKTTP